MKQALLDLRNAIMSDYSIRRFTMTWSDVVEAITKKYPDEPVNDRMSFEDKYVTAAHIATKGKMNDLIDTFARELNMNIQTMREKKLRQY